jgi:hypothetical protein
LLKGALVSIICIAIALRVIVFGKKLQERDEGAEVRSAEGRILKFWRSVCGAVPAGQVLSFQERTG